MTREEAIQVLKEISATLKSWSGFSEYPQAIDMAIEALQADAVPTMTEKVREALMRLTMCAREECGMCKYKDECGFNFQYNISTENMHTILDALSADAIEFDFNKHQPRVRNKVYDEHDLVKVVRCKDCIHLTTEYSDEGTCFYWCKHWDNATDEWGHCYFGERREPCD